MVKSGAKPAQREGSARTPYSSTASPPYQPPPLTRLAKKKAPFFHSPFLLLKAAPRLPANHQHHIPDPSSFTMLPLNSFGMKDPTCVPPTYPQECLVEERKRQKANKYVQCCPQLLPPSWYRKLVCPLWARHDHTITIY